MPQIRKEHLLGITNTDYTYAQIDGASSMLTGGIPNVNTELVVPMQSETFQLMLLVTTKTVDKIR